MAHSKGSTHVTSGATARGAWRGPHLTRPTKVTCRNSSRKSRGPHCCRTGPLGAQHGGVFSAWPAHPGTTVPAPLDPGCATWLCHRPWPTWADLPHPSKSKAKPALELQVGIRGLSSSEGFSGTRARSVRSEHGEPRFHSSDTPLAGDVSVSFLTLNGFLYVGWAYPCALRDPRVPKREW